MAESAAAHAAAAQAAAADVALLEEQFSAAADHLAHLVSGNAAAVPNAVKLELYGLYKQATAGPCSTKKPAFWDQSGCLKWNAWSKLGSLPQPAAMEQYVQVLSSHVPGWQQAAAARSSSGGGAGAGGSSSSTGGGGSLGGPVFSTLMGSGSSQRDEGPAGLHELAGQGDVAALAELLAGASSPGVNDRDENGCTPLHFAADRGQVAALVLLLDAGADINAADADGQTALHYAAMCDEEQAFRLLLARGADTGLRDADGKTAQEIAPPSWPAMN